MYQTDMSDKGDTDICSQCGKRYKRIVVHWARSSTCEAERFSDQQVEILEGLLMTGGTFSFSQSNNAAYQVQSTKEQFLEFINDQFSLLGGPVTQSLNEDESAASIRDTFSLDEDEEIDASAVYIWYTKTLPHMTELVDRWTDTDDTKNRILPHNFTISPISLAVAYASAGRLDTDGSGYRESETVAFTTNATPLSTDAWMQILDSFEPYAQKISDDQTVVYLRDSVAFFEYINTNSLLGDEPFPGVAGKWPDNVSELRTLTNSSETCPECQVQVESLGQHWAQSSCEPPTPSSDLQNLLTGMLLVSGSVSDRETETPFLQFNTTNESLAEWVNERLGVLGTEVTMIPGSTKEGCIDGETFTSTSRDSYRIKTRHLPSNREFSEWYDGGDKCVPESKIKRTDELLRGMYVMRGSLRSEFGQGALPVIPITRVDASEVFFQQLLSPFSPEIRERENQVVAICRDRQAFFDYIGWDAPPGCDSKWPTDSETIDASRVTQCPSCGNSFASISVHWNKGSDCEHPAFSEHQKRLLDGIALTGVQVRDSEKLSYPEIAFLSTNIDLLQWLNEEFDSLSVSPSVRKEGGENSRPQYAFRIRPHPYLNKHRKVWEEEPTFNPEDISPEVFAVVFGRCARYSYDKYSSKSVLRLSTARTQWNVEQWMTALDVLDIGITEIEEETASIVFSGFEDVFGCIDQAGWKTAVPQDTTD